MKSLISSSLGLLTTVSLGSLFAAPAQAGETCNYLNNNLFMAQGFQNERNIWISEGWWVIQPGECVTYADSALTYFKIEEDVAPARNTDAPVTQNTLCVVNDRFTVVQADNADACDTAGGSMVTFLNLGSTTELLKLP